MKAVVRGSSSPAAVSWRRPAFLPLLAALFLLLPALAGCGFISGDSGGGNDGAIELIDFGDDEPAVFQDTVQEKRTEVAEGFMLQPQTVGTVRFVYEHQVLLERFNHLLSRLEAALQDTGPEEVDLDWVILVLGIAQDADALFAEIIGHDVPVYLEEDFGHLYLALLDVVKFAGVSVDRAAVAALEVGPSGRSLLAMTPQETARFNVLARESRYYLEAAKELLQEQVTEIGGIAGQMTFR